MLSALIVDDSSTMRKMLAGLLTDMNYKIAGTASSGAEGIELYEKYKPDFVTMDVNMPGMSGVDALKVIRDTNKDANILMLSSRGDDKVVVDSIKYGAKGYILKPLNRDKINQAITNIFPSEIKTKIKTKNEDENQNIQDYESSIKDSLTNLYTVQYMHHTMQHLIEMHDRNAEFCIGLLIVRINNLEVISEEFGHMQKDIILLQVADEIQETIRTTDFPIKLTNNEFGIFILGEATKDIDTLAIRLKESIEDIQNSAAIGNTSLEVSIGMALHQKEEKLIPFLERTDKAVLKATKEIDSRIYMSK